MPRPGDRISHYKLISAIGKGGMGEVYLAEDTRLERRVAIKILLDDLSGDADRVRRFVQEAKAASALNHPNILTVYEIGDYHDSKYIAAELIEGDTLRERMRRGGMALNEAIGIALQAATALAAAHQSGILHRDIKPENIMVRHDGLVKVLDFGLAKLTEQAFPAASAEAPTLAHIDTLPGVLVGTVAYMSPEQVRGQKLDVRTDIFSLGTVMYELFTGQFPFKGESHLDIASAVLKDDPTPVRELSPEVPRQLERIIHKALRKDREHRYQHIKDLKIDLEDLQDELKFEAKHATTTAERRVPAAMTERLSLSETISTKRRFTLLHAIIFFVAAAAVTGAVWFLRPASSSQPGKYKISEVASWNSAPGELINNAKFSPDGKLIAFSSTRSGSKNIWVTQTGSTDAIQITNDTFSNTDPVWSPKRDEIAFLSTGRANGPGIWRVSALGGTPRQVAAVDSAARVRTWTSSGKIFYQIKSDLFAVDVATGASQKVSSFEGQNIPYLDISDDERTVLVVTQSNDDWRISTGSPASGALTKVIGGSGRLDGEGITWLPEKRRVLYSAAVNGVLQVFAVTMGSGRAAQLTASDADLTVSDAAPDGGSIIVTSSKEESNLWRVALADGTEAPLVRDINTKIWPAVSPDNQRIAFQTVKNLNQGDKLFDTTIVAKSSQGSADADRPATIAERGVLPTWSPDGKTLAFLRKNGETVDIFAADPNGGGERRLAGGITTAPYSVSPYNYGQAAAMAWAPDGSRIAYVSKRTGASNIWITAVTDGSETPLTDNRDVSISYQCPMWSTDGQRIAFSYERRPLDRSALQADGLCVIDLNTRQMTSVHESPKYLRLLGWSSDGTSLISAERETTKSLQPVELRRTTVVGSASTMVADLQNVYFYNIFLSDDRKTIAYAARNDNRDDLWTLSATGGTPRKLTANNDPGLYYSRLAWLHDGSAIVFGKQTRFSLLSMITDLDQ